LTEDIIRAFGYLCLGSRFRRIGERLQADTQQIIDASGVAIQAGQYPFLAAIDRAGPLTIGELAEAAPAGVADGGWISTHRPFEAGDMAAHRGCRARSLRPPLGTAARTAGRHRGRAGRHAAGAQAEGNSGG
jgi:hypothetical protein